MARMNPRCNRAAISAIQAGAARLISVRSPRAGLGVGESGIQGVGGKRYIHENEAGAVAIDASFPPAVGAPHDASTGNASGNH